ncbi:tyrosine-type recombinase/integrase [Leptospira interrogans]
MRAKITTQRLKQAQSQAETSLKDLYLWDTELKGFGVRVSHTGCTSWVIQRWYGGRGGKAFRFVLDQYPKLSLEQARKQAQIALAESLKGTNLVARRKDLRTKLSTDLANTLESVVKDYLKARSTGSEYWKSTENRFNNVILPALGTSTPLATITKVELKQLKLDDHNLYSTLSAFYRFCMEQDYITSNPMDTVPSPKVPKARERYLSPKEIKRYIEATDALSYPWKQYFQFLLHCAQRRDEVASMEWSELDIERNVWTIPNTKTKNGKYHIVVLTPQSKDILLSVPKQNSRFVFTTNLVTPISGFSKARSLLPTFDQPWVLHDLRRTFASTVAELGILPDVADRVLNHVSGTQSGVKGVYQRYAFLSERKEALRVWSEYVAKVGFD